MNGQICTKCGHLKLEPWRGYCRHETSRFGKRPIIYCGCKCTFPVATEAGENQDSNNAAQNSSGPRTESLKTSELNADVLHKWTPDSNGICNVCGATKTWQYHIEPPDLDALAADVLEMCKVRGWSLHWTHRGAYLHLESSELIEAVRGKRGSVVDEAGDVLIVLMSITANAGIPFTEVVGAATAKLDGLFTKPHYAGEEWTPHSEPERETETTTQG